MITYNLFTNQFWGFDQNPDFFYGTATFLRTNHSYIYLKITFDQSEWTVINQQVKKSFGQSGLVVSDMTNVKFPYFRCPTEVGGQEIFQIYQLDA